jgi:hypothetical protein
VTVVVVVAGEAAAGVTHGLLLLDGVRGGSGTRAAAAEVAAGAARARRANAPAALLPRSRQWLCASDLIGSKWQAIG